METTFAKVINKYDSSSSLPWLSTTLFAVATASVYYGWSALKKKSLFQLQSTLTKKDGISDNNITLPVPVAPKGILDTIRLMSGNQTPFFLQEMVKACNSQIYKLNLPIPNGMYVIGDYRAQREILTESDKPIDIYKHFAKMFDSRPNIFTRATSDPMWKIARKGSAPAFSSTEINRMNRVCYKHLNEWITNTLQPCIENGTSFDPSREMTKLTFYIIMESAFEYTPTQSEYKELIYEIELCLREFSFKQSTNPLRAIIGKYCIPETRRAYQAAKHLQRFSQKVLNTYRTNPNKSEQNTLIKLIEQNNGLLDDKQKVSEIGTFIIAGHDTTGYSLATALVLTAKHPDVGQKLRESLHDSQQTSSSSDYMQYVMMESNRLVPVAATGSIRNAGRDFYFNISTNNNEQEKIVHIPKDAVLFLPQILPNHDESVFNNPNEFNPERWVNATKEMKDAILMFSKGKRNCAGQSLATAELNTVLPRLFSEYKFEIETEGELDYFLTLKFAGARLKATRV